MNMTNVLLHVSVMYNSWSHFVGCKCFNVRIRMMQYRLRLCNAQVQRNGDKINFCQPVSIVIVTLLKFSYGHASPIASYWKPIRRSSTNSLDSHVLINSGLPSLCCLRQVTGATYTYNLVNTVNCVR